MKKILFLCIISLWGEKCISQDDFSKEYRLIRDNLENPYETLFEKTGELPKPLVEYKKDNLFIDHIIRKYSGPLNLKNFISNRYFLERFKYDYLLHDKAALEIFADNNKIRIEAKRINKSLKSLGNIHFDSTVFNGVRNEDDFTYIRSINSKEVYGLLWDTSNVSIISSITILLNDKQLVIEDSTFNDLFFPNFCEISPHRRPIEAFLSPNKKFIYLYITGGQVNFNYFCKIIFDIEQKKVVGRMVADNNELRWYRTSNRCFIGF